MLEMRTCDKQCLCVDCDNKECLHAGKAMADCPKYHCDNSNGIDECDNCDFLKQFQIDRIRGVTKHVNN